MAVYGIDLGTTYSCIASIDEVGRPAVLRNLEGTDTTPSVVYFESGDNVVVGATAKDTAVLDPDNVVSLIKRDMGRDVTRPIHGIDFAPEESFHRSHRLALAGDDPVVVAKIRIDIESKSVRCHPAFDMHADRRDFALDSVNAG